MHGWTFSQVHRWLIDAMNLNVSNPKIDCKWTMTIRPFEYLTSTLTPSLIHIHIRTAVIFFSISFKFNLLLIMLWRIKYTSAYLVQFRSPPAFYFHQFVNCIFFYRPTVFPSIFTSAPHNRIVTFRASPKYISRQIAKVLFDSIFERREQGKRGNGKSMMDPHCFEWVRCSTIDSFNSHIYESRGSYCIILRHPPIWKLPLLFNIPHL